MTTSYTTAMAYYCCYCYFYYCYYINDKNDDDVVYVMIMYKVWAKALC